MPRDHYSTAKHHISVSRKKRKTQKYKKQLQTPYYYRYKHSLIKHYSCCVAILLLFEWRQWQGKWWVEWKWWGDGGGCDTLGLGLDNILLPRLAELGLVLWMLDRHTVHISLRKCIEFKLKIISTIYTFHIFIVIISSTVCFTTKMKLNVCWKNKKMEKTERKEILKNKKLATKNNEIKMYYNFHETWWGVSIRGSNRSWVGSCGGVERRWADWLWASRKGSSEERLILG